MIRNSREFEAKVAYIVENPIMRRLVNNPSDYKWLWLDPEDFSW